MTPNTNKNSNSISFNQNNKLCHTQTNETDVPANTKKNTNRNSTSFKQGRGNKYCQIYYN